MIKDIQDKQSFNSDLQDYWQVKGITPLKNPVIGGRDLDFYTLYKAVCKRGGAQAVSNNKLWKEVIDELRLPPTSTSASFHIKNHYQRYLLGYELKNTQGQDDKFLPTLTPGRDTKKSHGGGGGVGIPRPQRQTRNTETGNREQTNNNNEEDSSEDSVSQSELQIENKGKVLHPSQVNPASSQLGQDLQSMYSKQDKREEICIMKKTKMFPTKSEVKRITLAFESRLQDELVYAINTLLLYSINMQSHFQFDNAHGLLDNITQYLEQSMKNISSLSKIFQMKQIKKHQYNNELLPQNSSEENKETPNNYIDSLNILDNYNYPVPTIILFNLKHNIEISPLKLLQKNKQQNIQNLYEQVGEVQILEQVRAIFQILRNLSFIRSNELAIVKNERLCQLLLQLFLLNADVEISKSVLDIIANISKHIQLNKIQDYEQFCSRLFDVLHSDSNDELEAGVQSMRNLISLQENESILEDMVTQYIDALTRLLLYSHGEIREGVLEFLCYLSDLKMKTKVTLAKQPKLIIRLIGLLGSGIGKQYEKITKLSAQIINNILIAPASRKYILPFEKDLFVIASNDENVSQQLGEIINEFYNCELEENQ